MRFSVARWALTKSMHLLPETLSIFCHKLTAALGITAGTGGQFDADAVRL